MFMVDKLVDVDENNQPAMRAWGTRFCKGFWAVPPAMYSYTRADSMVRPYGICRDVIKHKAPALLATQQRGRHKRHNHCSLQDLLSLWQSGVYRCTHTVLRICPATDDFSLAPRPLAGQGRDTICALFYVSRQARPFLLVQVLLQIFQSLPTR